MQTRKAQQVFGRSWLTAGQKGDSIHVKYSECLRCEKKLISKVIVLHRGSTEWKYSLEENRLGIRDNIKTFKDGGGNERFSSVPGKMTYLNLCSGVGNNPHPCDAQICKRSDGFCVTTQTKPKKAQKKTQKKRKNTGKNVEESQIKRWKAAKKKTIKSQRKW